MFQPLTHLNGTGNKCRIEFKMNYEENEFEVNEFIFDMKNILLIKQSKSSESKSKSNHIKSEQVEIKSE